MLVFRIYSEIKCWNHKLLMLSLRTHEILNDIIYGRMASRTEVPDLETILMPPTNVRGMKKLDRDAFKKEIDVPTVNFPTKNFKSALKELKPYLLKVPNIQPVQGIEEKKVLLHPSLVNHVTQKFKYDILWSKLTLTYENYNHEFIFKAVLPQDTAGNVSGFSIVGHIIHVNLKPELSDYKQLIGEVFLDKFSNIKTVVNKAQTIDSEYRNFQLELLAGEPEYEVTVKENGFKYRFDFSKVFWNPRLVHEHHLIVMRADPGDLVFDIFAGVGPFAVPLAYKKCIVHANDLNPDSYKWLCCNTGLNKVSKFLTAYNLDGRDFIKNVVRDYMIKYMNEGKDSTIHIIMNLPACALEFLSTFQGLLKDHPLNNKLSPIVYLYFFVKKDETETEIVKKYVKEEHMTRTIEISPVRKVAPNKTMVRLVYRMPPSILFTAEEECNGNVSKKIKLS